MDLKFQKDKKF